MSMSFTLSPNTVPATNSSLAAIFHNKCFKFLFLTLALLWLGAGIGLFSSVSAQAANYQYSTTTTASLYDMSSGTSSLIATGTTQDDARSALTNIGFNFIFMDAVYTQFSVNTNGQLQLGSTLITTTFADPQSAPIIAPFSGNNQMQSSGVVRYRSFGTAPNRSLVIDWVDIKISNAASNTGPTLSRFQVAIFETTGKIEFIYGQMFNTNSSTNISRGIFFCDGTAAGDIGQITDISGTPTYNSNSTSLTTTTFPFATAMTNLNSSSNGSRRKFVFVPTTVTLNYIGNTNGSAVTGDWYVPCGIGNLTVTCFGGGGGGGSSNNGSNNGGSGGGGGAYSSTVFSSLTSGNLYYISAGGSGTGGPASSTTAPNPGGDSWFNTSNAAPTNTNGVLAKGGGAGVNNSASTPTNKALASAGYGTTKTDGGNGGAGDGFNGGGGGGGGGNVNANNGGGATGSAGGTGAVAVSGGAGGGDGGAGNSNGNVGAQGGGGGGGSGDYSTRNGGRGGQGIVRLSYTLSLAITTPTATITQPTCSVATGSITVSAPTGSCYEYELDNSGTWQSSATFSTVASGDHTVKARWVNYPETVSSASATLTVNTQPTAPTVATPSTPSAICAGGSYNPTTPSVSANGSAITSQGWQIETTVGGGTYTSLTVPYTVAYADNGKKVRYTATNDCNTTNSSTVTLTVNDIPQSPSAGSNSRCGTGTVELSVSGSGGTYKWYNDAGLTTQVGTGASFTTPSISITTDYYVTETTSGCASSATTVTATVNNCGSTYTLSYNGNSNTGGSVPASTSGITGGSSVSVASNTGTLVKSGYNFLGWNTAANGSGTFYLAGASITVNSDITLYARWATTAAAPGSKFWVGGTGNWNVAGNWNPSGVPTTESIFIDAGTPTMNVDVTLGAGRSLTILDPAGLTINPGITLTIAGSADFGDRPVNLKSDATGTAAIGQVTGSLLGATSVTVERYVQARRKWRALTAPLTGSSNNSIYYNWQNNGSVNGGGVMIWSPSAGAGVYSGGGASSMISYNSTGNNWSAVTNTQTSLLFNGSGNNAYMTFVTGPYNTSGNYVTSGSGSANTTLRATGTLRQGDLVMSNLAGNNQFVFVGNPFASAINLKSIAKTGYTNFAYTWDPSLNALGGYVTINTNSGTDASNTIESGQAFFMQANNAANSLTFEEADKVSSVSNLGNFRMSESGTPGQISIDLNKYVNGSLNKYDNATCDFVSGANAGLDGDDALKPSQFYENLSIYRFGKDLSWETRPEILSNDTLQLRMWAMQQANYQLKVSTKNIQLPAGMTALLQDQHLGTETVLNTNGNTLIDFSVNANSTSTGDRFRVVFRGSAVTPVTDLSGAKGFSVYPNPLVKGSSAQIEFRNRAAGKYTVTLFTIAGVRVQQDILSHAGGTAVQSLKLSSQLSSGTYIAEISSVNGVSEKVKVVVE